MKESCGASGRRVRDDGGPGIREICPSCGAEVAVNGDGRIREHGASRRPTITTDDNGHAVNASSNGASMFCGFCGMGNCSMCRTVCACSVMNHRPDDKLAAKMRCYQFYGSAKEYPEAELAAQWREVAAR